MGTLLWFTLHTITLSYPDNPTYENKRHYNDFFIGLQNVIPCPNVENTINPIFQIILYQQHWILKNIL